MFSFLLSHFKSQFTRLNLIEFYFCMPWLLCRDLTNKMKYFTPVFSSWVSINVICILIGLKSMKWICKMSSPLILRTWMSKNKECIKTESGWLNTFTVNIWIFYRFNKISSLALKLKAKWKRPRFFVDLLWLVPFWSCLLTFQYSRYN